MTRPALKPADVAAWIRAETPEHLQLLSRMRARLADTMDHDTNDKSMPGQPGTPSRDWCRAFQRYQQGFAAVLTEAREQVKLQIIAKKLGLDPQISDEELEAGLRELALEGLGALSVDELHRELERRAALAEPEPEDKEDEN